MNTPKVGDFFSIKFRNGDRSYSDQVFICCNSDGRSVIGQRLVRERYLGPKLFEEGEVEFVEPRMSILALLTSLSKD